MDILGLGLAFAAGIVVALTLKRVGTTFRRLAPSLLRTVSLSVMLILAAIGAINVVAFLLSAQP